MGDNRWPEINPGRKTVWTPTTPPDASDVVNEKIMSAFRCVTSFPSKRIIVQFWRPAFRKAVLVCGGNPFSFPLLNPLLFKYRSRCSCYSYNINIHVDDPMTITGAPPSTAFLTGFPEVVMDLRVHRGTPLVDLALECELTCFVMLPVFDDETSCLGVIEVSARLPAHLLAIFNGLKQALLMAGLKISRSKAFILPYLDIGDLKLAGSETEKALHEAIHSHDITLGQVWITHGTCDRVLLRKLKTHHAKLPNDMSSLENFYNGLAILRLGKGEGLAGRTLETRQPHLCKNIYKLKDNRGLLALLSANAKCTSFVICLRSSHTPELDYVFEFFWPQTNNHFALIEKLLLTLKEHLPSFKHDSGVQLETRWKDT
ncbi:protein NLP7-like [Bidens hawaiensis]|uniref:protein NLP7-like n=1 Tax=Bidens hawaiensis TaxID=980011 RepID=UPI00404AF41F